jgi:hypothetical protein
LGLWPDDGQYGLMELKGSKLGLLSLFTINIKFLIDRVPSCPTFEIWDFGRIGELAIDAADHGIITALTSSIQSRRTQVILENS